jgi:long-chain fatty acid transport protein
MEEAAMRRGSWGQWIGLPVMMAAAVSSAPALAGAFALREQSAAALGMSFAGAAAGAGGLGTMFWNPATITQSPGIQVEGDFSGIFPYADITSGAGSSAGYLPPITTAIGGVTASGDIGQDAVLPAFYASWQVNDRVWLGVGVNAPFGLATKPDLGWAGRAYGASTRITSYDVTPTLGYKVNDWLSVGAGIEIMYFKARYTTAVPTLASLAPPVLATPSAWGVSGLEGDSTGIGFTLGATLRPFAGTEIGIGFRSAVSQTLDGEFSGGAALWQSLLPLVPPGTPPAVVQALAARQFDHPIKVGIVLPETVTLGLKQAVTADFSAMLGLEWTNWSRLGFPRVVDQTTGTLHQAIQALPLDYRDGWFVSAGGEYRINPAWTTRAGLAYELSPITTQNRSPRLPDNNRIWATLGASYAWSDQLSFDNRLRPYLPARHEDRHRPGQPAITMRVTRPWHWPIWSGPSRPTSTSSRSV